MHAAAGCAFAFSRASLAIRAFTAARMRAVRCGSGSAVRVCVPTALGVTGGARHGHALEDQREGQQQVAGLAKHSYQTTALPS